MFKGFISLFSSGLILHPMVLLGIGSGCFLSYRFDLEQIFDIFAYYDFYLVGAAIAFVYTFAFNQVYKGYSNTVDWDETFKRFLGNAGTLILTMVLSSIFFETLIF